MNLPKIYAKVVGQDGQTLDSVSCDGPSDICEAQSVNHAAAHCEIVSQITTQQW